MRAPLLSLLLAFNCQAQAQDTLTTCGLVPNTQSAAAANSAAIETCMASMYTGFRKRLYVPPGNWFFAAPIVNKSGIVFEGDHMSVSVLIATHAGTAFLATGELGLGGCLKNVSVGFKDVTGNIAVRLMGNSVTQPDFFCIENVNVTHYSGGTMAYGVLVDGDARAPSSGLQGIRNINIRNLTIFNVAGGNSFEVRNGKGIQVDQLQLYQGGGTSTTAFVRGTPTGSLWSAGVFFSNSNVGWMIFETTWGFSYIGGVINLGAQASSTTGSGLFNASGVVPANYAGSSVKVQ